MPIQRIEVITDDTACPWSGNHRGCREMPTASGAAAEACTIRVRAECRVRWGRGPVPGTAVAGTFPGEFL